MSLKPFFQCVVLLFFSAFSLGASIPEFWDIENQMVPGNYRISSDASVEDVKQEIDTSIFFEKTHAILTINYIGLLFYLDQKDAFPLVALYLGYSALIYFASSFDNHATYKILQLPEAKIALEKLIFHQRNQACFYGLSSMCYVCDAIFNPLLDFPFANYAALFAVIAVRNSFMFE